MKKISSLDIDRDLLSARLCAKYLISVNSSGHGPCGDDVVHDPLTEALGNLVELQEVSHTVQHLVVAVGVGIHLLEDGGYITKDGGIEES